MPLCRVYTVCVCVWGGGGGGHFTLGGGGGGGGGGGQFALVQNVRGDIPHGGTIHPPTPACKYEKSHVTATKYSSWGRETS